MKENFNGQILLPKENKVKNAIVFLHGYGANAEDLINIGEELNPKKIVVVIGYKHELLENH